VVTTIKKLKKHKYVNYGYALLAIPVIFLIFYYYNNNPEVSPEVGFFPQCPFHAITGFHCPGCGSQRAIHDLLHFRIGESLSHNIVIIILALTIVSKAYAFISKHYFKKYQYDLSRKPFFTIGIAAFVFLYWILRNIPIYPFSELAP